jgi:hypothetical protein
MSTRSRSLFAGLLTSCVFLLAARITPAAAPPGEPEAGMICKVYPVADLVIPIAGTFAARTEDGKPAANRTHEDRLIQLVCSVLAPRSWRCGGGRASIGYFPLGMALVVRHTPEMQEQVADLLAALRRLQEIEVSVELRFLTISDECMAKLGIEDADGGKTSIARLDDGQVRLLLETAQGDMRTNVMQAPKLTVFNGQKATMDLTEKQVFVTSAEMVSVGERKIPQLHTKNVGTGLQVSVLPVVAPDNRTVTLQLGVNLTRADVPRLSASAVLMGKSAEKHATAGLTLVAPLEPCFSTRSFETTLKLADGTTALISGWTQHREVRNQTCPPVLSKIPYINRLFCTMSYGKEREHLLVMVTPRVIVQAEKEEHVPAEVKPPVAAEVLPMPQLLPCETPLPAETKPAIMEELLPMPRLIDTDTPAPTGPTEARSDSCQLPPGWVVVRGRVREAARCIDGQKTYVVEMEYPGYIRPVAYANVAKGVDLRSYVGKVVEVQGPAVYRGDIRTKYMTVMRIVP